MAIGSAFDAFVKNYLAHNLFGECPPQFEIEKIFEDQVEPQHRDWAFENGEYVFECYKKTGALADLMIELSAAVKGSLRMEFTLEGRIAHEKHVDGIPLLGKPDCHVDLASGGMLTLDWKVNGYCATRPTSPKRGYVCLREPDGKRVMHKDCQAMMISGINTNIATTLDQIDESWATQLAIYKWILGEPIPTKGIVGIEQIVCVPQASGRPLIRVASHRMRIDCGWQLSLLNTIASIWDAIQSGTVVSPERALMLDEQYKAYSTDGTPNDDWFQKAMRG
jgi:hypothetical protein